jgi:hypothetical protein
MLTWVKVASIRLFGGPVTHLNLCYCLSYKVRCGPGGGGYEFKIATSALKMLAPALQWGLFAMKVILATQGTVLIMLHGIIWHPSSSVVINSFLPPSIA